MDPVKGSILNPCESCESELELQTINTPRLPIDRLRKAALEKGRGGIGDLGSMFRRFDISGNQKIDISQFNRGCQEYKLGLTSGETRELFNRIDRSRNGTIDYEEFLAAVRPNLSKARLQAIQNIYTVLDPTDKGYATEDDIRRCYKTKNNARYKSGEATEDEVIRQFTSVGGSSANDRIMRSHFIDFYAYISTTMPCDDDFLRLLDRFWDKSRVKYSSVDGGSPLPPAAAADVTDRSDSRYQSPTRAALYRGTEHSSDLARDKERNNHLFDK